MNIYLLFIVLISILWIRIYIKDSNHEYLNKTNSSCIKGIFILIVFSSHIMQYASYNKNIDLFSVNLIKNIGQLMVTMFLFYSGYGVFESIKNKNNYVKSIPKKRILNTLINFDICVLLYFMIYMIYNNDFEITRFVLSLIGWDGYGNSNWYIFCILGLYLLTYIVCSIFKKDYKRIIFIWIFTIIFYILLSISKESYWYNTLFCYPLGITYSYFKNEIDKFIFNNKKYIIILAITIIINIIMYRFKTNIIVYDIMSCTFAILVVLLSVKIKFNSKILLWFGNNLFWIYMLQRIPMIILKNNGFNQNQYKYFAICFIYTILMTIIVNLIKKSKKILN